MTNSKILKIENEIRKTREKITEYQSKLKGLEMQKKEAEDIKIVQMVRALRMTPAELKEFLAKGIIPTAAPIKENKHMEDTENEK